MTKMMTPAQIADALCISRQTIYNKVSRGEWPSVRLGNKVRIPAWFVEDLISSEEAWHGEYRQEHRESEPESVG
jgi:excisionase family DNA binding protein